MASFLRFRPYAGAAAMTPDALRQQFQSHGLRTVLDGEGTPNSLYIAFEPSADVLYLTVERGLVTGAELSPDYRRGIGLSARIVDVLTGADYECVDDD